MRLTHILLALLVACAGWSVEIDLGLGPPAASSSGGSGTVTSVAATVPAELSVAGSPVTTSGTLAVTWAAASGRKFIASPNDGTSGAYAGRAIIGADIATALASPPAIGGTAPAAITGTTITGTGVTAISAATQDAVALSGRSGGTGSWVVTLTPTTLSASRTVTLPDANSNTVVPSTAAAHQFATAISSGGVVTWTQPASTDISGLGTIATQAANNVALTGGTIDGTTIGGTTAGAGTFTTCTVNTTLTGGSSASMSFAPSQDTVQQIGYLKLGMVSGGTSTKIYLAQTTVFTTTGFGFSQNSSGSSAVNAPTGQTVTVSINGTGKWSVGTQITATIAESNTGTTDATSPTTGEYTTAGGISGGKNGIFGEGVHCGVTSTATAAGTTTLTSSSTGVQKFTGSTTQTVQLPAANVFGSSVAVHYVLINESSGNVSWQRAGSDTINGGTSTVAVSANTIGEIWSDGGTAWRTK